MVFAYSQIAEFLCEIGIKLYQQGKYTEALHEFEKALIAQPNYKPALSYIQMIEAQLKPKEVEKVIPIPISPPTYKPPLPSKSEAVKELLDFIELQKAMVKEKIKPPKPEPRLIIPEERKIPPPKVMILDESLKKITVPLEIEQQKSIILKGKNIQRFLVTEPEVILVERRSSDELLLTGNKIGYTYLHIWDEVGRWTLEFLCTLPKPEGPTLEEQMRLEEIRQEAFRIRYSLDWHSYEEGRRLDNLNQRYYLWDHHLSLTGATPYGDVDSTAIVKSSKQSTDLTYFTLGLTEGRFGPFKDFSLRGFDFYPRFINMATGGISTLRGVMLSSEAFNKRIDYTAFWGREGGGRYGNLSPGLQETIDSFINGFDINYSPKQGFNYGFSILHGYGDERPFNLRDYVYDARASWHWRGWGYNYELGYDTKSLVHIFSGSYVIPKLKFAYELRDIDPDFLNIVGNVWRSGELGALFNLDLEPHEQLSLSSHLNLYRDRNFPASDNLRRFNQDFDFISYYRINPNATLRLDYTLQNDLGRLSQDRYQSAGLGLSKAFNLIRNINSFINLRHHERKSFSNPASNYTNENLSTGIRFSLIGNLYYFLNKEWNWLEARYTGERSKPEALETGFDLSGQIARTPFYPHLRFVYRDEEDTVSNFSYLSGEDYIEGYAELSYRPTTDSEIYCASRVRNVWAENPTVNKRIEADFNLGMRYLWNTGLRWETTASIEGYVFKDLNSDGLRQKDEAPVEGVRIWLGKNRSATTDIFGHYRFPKVKGKKVYLTLDTSTLPPGFVLTVPQRQEVTIVQSKPIQVNFGIVSRTEISGIVFYDANDDNEFNLQDQPIKGVVLTLEDGTKAITGIDGRFSFRNASVGKHLLSLDLKSLPLDYLPKIPITNEIILSEGLTYIYNIPLKKTIK